MGRASNLLCALLWLGAACQGQTSSGTGLGDGGTSAGSRDLATPALPPATMTTIRQLNQNQLPAGTRVHVEGVVQSPVAAGYAVDFDQSCLYELMVVQADPSPTLQDGIAVRMIQRGVVSGDMMLRDPDCQQLVAQTSLGKVKRGDAATIEGTLIIANGLHSIDLGTIGQVIGQGKAQTQPQPVVVTAAQLPSAPFDTTPPVPPFVSAYGALVQLQGVVTSELHAATRTFKVSAAATDASKTRISTAYLQILDPNYQPPADGTPYHAVTGVVSTDLGGTLLLRGSDDLTP
jgi:hypothetical protein